MEQYWVKIKEFQGVQLLRDPETMQCRVVPIERPQPQQKLVYSPEAISATEKAFELYRLTREAGERSQAAAMLQPPQPERPKTPEETWRHDPALRVEFSNNINAYLAYCKAVAAGRCRIFGR